MTSTRKEHHSMRGLGLSGAFLVAGMTIAACGSDGSTTTTDGGATHPGADGGPASATDGGNGGTTQQGDGGGGGGTDAGSGGPPPPSGPISCTTPSNTWKKNGGACGTERWDVKTGTDTAAKSINMTPKLTTIDTLIALKAPTSPTTRISPTEDTIWELRDVIMSMIKLETDSDYHMVLTDQTGKYSMIVEIPYPSCASTGAWSCFISNARATVDAKWNVTASPQYPALIVTVRGVGFFDFPHGQNGEAPNSIELHSVLSVCFGKGCTPL